MSNVVNQSGNETGLSLVSNPDMSKILSELKSMKTGLNIVPRYKEFSKGEKVRGVFAGFSQLATKDGELLDASCWIDEGGNMWQNAGVGLVGSFIGAKISKGTPIEIEFEGTKKVDKGTMNVFAVRILFSNE